MMGSARVECAECGQKTDWSAHGSNLCSRCESDDDIREGTLYHVVDFDMIVRVEDVDRDEDVVRIEQVDGGYENTVGIRTFEARIDDEKVVPKTVAEGGEAA